MPKPLLRTFVLNGALTIQKVPVDEIWIPLSNGYTGHATGTTSALWAQRGGNILGYITIIDTAMPSQSYPFGWHQLATVGANAHFVNIPFIPDLVLDGQEGDYLQFTGDASSGCTITVQVIKISSLAEEKVVIPTRIPQRLSGWQ